MKYGIDVSQWQGDIDFSKLPSLDFVYIKAGGADNGIYTDTKLYKNWVGFGSTPKGIYWYYYPTIAWELQYMAILEIQKNLGHADLPLAIDVECDTYIAENSLLRLCNRFDSKPMIYTSIGTWQKQLVSAEWETYPLWIANYGVNSPMLPSVFKSWQYWQYTSDGVVAGIKGNVDKSKCAV